jgi:predicted DNA-binding mobile mystery protein A
MRRKLDRRLATLDPTKWALPVGGWLRTIRQALGMSTVELAERMGISDTRAGRLERAEAQGSLKLSTLRRAAEALNCRLLYVLVPEEPLEDMVFRQAYLKAADELGVPASAAFGTDDLNADIEDELEARTLQLVDRQGLWHVKPTPAHRRPPGGADLPTPHP